MAEPERISFPTDYPIKVVARSAPALRASLDAVFTRHFGAFHEDRVTERGSAQGNFIALTYLMRVESETQLSALNAELQALPEVLFVF